MISNASQRLGSGPLRHRRLIAFVAAAALLLPATYALDALTARSVPAPAAAVPPVAPLELPPLAPPAGPSDILLDRYDRAIRAWTAGLDANAANYLAATNLSTLYAGRGRLTGDLADYQRGLEAADRALTARPGYAPAQELRATIHFSLHDFTTARTEAQAVWQANPGALQALAVIGDAALELGDIDGARAAYLKLGEGASSAPVWSRLAHLAFVTGQADQATELVKRAVDATAGEPASEASAFYAFQLGELYRAAGQLDKAEAAYQDALTILPDHVPATAGLARIREAQGRRGEAIALLEPAAARLPQPELVAALGDLYALSGDAVAAERQYALVERIGSVAQATGSVYDRQLVLFAADHDRGVEAAVARAQAELAIRKDIYGYDALAWALFHAGRIDEAAAAAARALALDTPDPRLAYHAGMIAAAGGNTDEARRLLGQAVAGAAYLPALQVSIAQRALGALEEPAS